MRHGVFAYLCRTMNNSTSTPTSLRTGRFAFGEAARPSPLAGGTVSDHGVIHGGTSGERQFLDHAIVGQFTLATLNRYEDLGVLLNDPDFVFEVMELKDRLGLPVGRQRK